MARYRVLREGGVLDTQTGRNLQPFAAEFQAYREWLALGNTPDDPLPITVVQAGPDYEQAGRARALRQFQKLTPDEAARALLERDRKSVV